MPAKWNILLLSAVLTLVSLVQACSNKETMASQRFSYTEFRDSILHRSTDTLPDTASSNVLDSNFIPGARSFEHLLVRMYTLWKLEAAMLKKRETSVLNRDSASGYTDEEKMALQENISELDSFLRSSRDSTPPGNCRETACALYVEVVKSEQRLFLYIDGELADSFKVSTGVTGYETPDMNLRPLGPVLTRYTSRKFPGGNYMGLGNMPYAVFLKNGYAIHGTTPGNFSRLGRRASHGCIRLHPENAKLFNQLVKRVGLKNTWVRVTDQRTPVPQPIVHVP
ncbi:MAG TPA: L,D-transpeptidase [Chitinophagaceae bacterium]